MNAEQYLQMKKENLLKKYGRISKPLMKQIYKEAYEKFGRPETKSLDELISDNKKICDMSKDTFVSEISLECVLNSDEILYMEEETISKPYKHTRIDIEKGPEEVNLAYIKDDDDNR